MRLREQLSRRLNRGALGMQNRTVRSGDRPGPRRRDAPESRPVDDPRARPAREHPPDPAEVPRGSPGVVRGDWIGSGTAGGNGGDLSPGPPAKSAAGALGRDELVLSYGPGTRRQTMVLGGVGGLAVVLTLVVFVIGVRSDPAAGSGTQAALELFALACVGLAGWALPTAIRRLRARGDEGFRGGPVIRMDREGLQFRSRAGGPVVVSAPWSLVERCAFRPAPGGSPVWCVDAPTALPSSLSFAAAWAGMVPWTQVDTRVDELAAIWRTLGAPADRRLLRDSLLFGTPVVIDLARCSGVTVTMVDSVVRHWTSDRCRCTPAESPAPAGGLHPGVEPDLGNTPAPGWGA